ncbi:MAG: FAD:protein FMN transferase, partial [Bacteroidales bacterium]|nr:FAD:protein FMN transferase [Bacteroidales bacterium]
MQNFTKQPDQNPAKLQTAFDALGTRNQIQVLAYRERSAAAKALKQAQARVRVLHDRLSVFQPESELSLLNASAGCTSVAVSADTYFLLSESRRYSALS